MPPTRLRRRSSPPPAMDACARKRRRPTVVASDTAVSSPVWASLPGDLVRMISWRVLAGDLLDYVRFRAVCTNWRSDTLCPRGRCVVDPRFHPRRWMLLPEGHGLYPGHGKLRGYVRFFNLDTGTFVRVRLPLFRDHCALDSVDGLLLLQRDEDTAIRLLHPFTGDIAEFPRLDTLLPQLDDDLRQNDPFLNLPDDLDSVRWFYIRNNLCASVCCSPGATTVMLCHRLRRVAFATSQDQQWTMPSWEVPHNLGPFSFQGKLYVVHHPTLCGKSQVFQMDPPLQHGLPPPPPKLIATCPADKLYFGFGLVECDSEILMVGHTDSSRSHILIYKLADLVMEKFIPVTSIGGRALFVEKRSFSVSTKALPTVTGETVVYSRSGDFVQYHLSSNTEFPTVDECSKDGYVPGPRSLIHHITSCCFRNAWNKGLVYNKKEASKAGWLKWKVKRRFRQWP